MSTGCAVHPVKPTQCRLFPFWPEFVERVSAWSQLGRWCPGVGVGSRYSLGRALEIAYAMRQAYPELYGDVGTKSSKS